MTEKHGSVPIHLNFCRKNMSWPSLKQYGSHQRGRGGRVVRWSWVNFQCRGVLLIWIRVGQGPIALAVGAGGGCLDIFTLLYPFSPLSPSLWETARYRLKYCLKGPLNPKQPTNQPTHQRGSSNESLQHMFCRGVTEADLEIIIKTPHNVFKYTFSIMTINNQGILRLMIRNQQTCES